MRKLVVTMVLGALLAAGCAQGTANTGSGVTEGADGRKVGLDVPPDSLLAQVQPGMKKTQVQSILGMPTAENSYATGKAFIPFYFGNDVRRTSWYYKGLGRVVFADGNVFGGGGGEVVRVDYDPSETGVPPR